MTHATMTPYINVAVIEKTQGLHGELVVRGIAKLPFTLSEGTEIYLTPPSLRTTNKFHIKSFIGDNQSACITFFEIDSIDDAAPLVGKTLLAKRDQVLRSTQNACKNDSKFCSLSLHESSEAITHFDSTDIIGRKIICKRLGNLGTIEDIIVTAAHDVWRVQGPYGEVLIPAVAEFILSVPDSIENPICAQLPFGLIDQEAEEIRP